ncbi:hypothetical protein [Prosthecobacter sp.]|uniref:hypothetical protein n=1 Tax=Prosthecobacter sp. TaxID=1965333 RepID=UPI003784DC94
MKAILLVLSFAVLAASATTLGLMTVKMPIYLHGSDSDATIEIMDIPVMNASDTNSARYHAICQTFIPPSLSSTIKPSNVNIACEYGIFVDLEEIQENGKWHWIITVDASTAKIPKGYPFTIDEVTDVVLKCAKSMTKVRPDEEIKVTFKVKTAQK